MSNIPNTAKVKAPRRQSKEDMAKSIVRIAQGYIAQGLSPDEAIEKLSVRQYDFLCDYKEGAYLDQIRPETAEEKAVRSEMAKADRKARTGGYNKKYPEPKKNLFMSLVEHVQSLGAEVQPKDKENFRDLDFTLDGVHYKIVLSNPRT